MWSSASSVDFSNGRGMYFIVSTFERNSVWDWHHFSTRLNSRFPDLERGEVYGQHYFVLFIGLEDFNTEFRLKSLFWVYYLDAFFLIRFPVLNRIRYQTKVQYKEMVQFSSKFPNVEILSNEL
jgi:hypothetical protein